MNGITLWKVKIAYRRGTDYSFRVIGIWADNEKEIFEKLATRYERDARLSFIQCEITPTGITDIQYEEKQ